VVLNFFPKMVTFSINRRPEIGAKTAKIIDRLKKAIASLKIIKTPVNKMSKRNHTLLCILSQVNYKTQCPITS
jgi:hypothetical protein